VTPINYDVNTLFTTLEIKITLKNEQKINLKKFEVQVTTMGLTSSDILRTSCMKIWQQQRNQLSFPDGLCFCFLSSSTPFHFIIFLKIKMKYFLVYFFHKPFFNILTIRTFKNIWYVSSILNCFYIKTKTPRIEFESESRIITPKISNCKILKVQIPYIISIVGSFQKTPANFGSIL